MQLKPGTVVCLEGIDAAGKSTQAAALEGRLHNIISVHMPSTGGPMCEDIYKLTETHGDTISPLSRQLLHLASHAQLYRDIVRPELDKGPLAKSFIFDRCWLSTWAYGYEAWGEYGIPDQVVNALVTIPTQGIGPDIIFLFTSAFNEDPHNTPELIARYEMFYEHAMRGGNSFPVVLVPPRDVEATTRFLIQNLQDYRLIGGSEEHSSLIIPGRR